MVSSTLLGGLLLTKSRASCGGDELPDAVAAHEENVVLWGDFYLRDFGLRAEAALAVPIDVAHGARHVEAWVLVFAGENAVVRGTIVLNTASCCLDPRPLLLVVRLVVASLVHHLHLLLRPVGPRPEHRAAVGAVREGEELLGLVVDDDRDGGARELRL